jgi:hypothetical protein
VLDWKTGLCCSRALVDRVSENHNRRRQSGWQISSDFPVAPPIQAGTNAALSDLAASVRLSPENGRVLPGANILVFSVARSTIACDA